MNKRPPLLPLPDTRQRITMSGATFKQVRHMLMMEDIPVGLGYNIPPKVQITGISFSCGSSRCTV